MRKHYAAKSSEKVINDTYKRPHNPNSENYEHGDGIVMKTQRFIFSLMMQKIM